MVTHTLDTFINFSYSVLKTFEICKFVWILSLSLCEIINDQTFIKCDLETIVLKGRVIASPRHVHWLYWFQIFTSIVPLPANSQFGLIHLLILITQVCLSCIWLSVDLRTNTKKTYV